MTRQGIAGGSNRGMGGRGRPGPLRLLAGISAGALVLGLATTPASAQLARMRAAAGTIAPPSAATVTAAAPVRPVTMTEALARQQALMTRAQAIAQYVRGARAAIDSIPGAASVTDGVSTNGLNPIAPVRAATIYVAAGAASAPAPNPAPAAVAAANDPTGIATWDGAGAPVQTAGSDGHVTVTISQTQQNAVLSWQNFDVGTNTALVFDQSAGGAAKTGWTVVNRVVDAANPSKILGSISAPGNVYILNSRGVIFGPNAQINLGSLIVSSLELGNFAAGVTIQGQTEYFVAASIADRNTAFLQNGLLVAGVGTFKGQILSGHLAPGLYNVNAPLPVPATLEGDVTVAAGAQITVGDGGYLIMAGPRVTNAGVLTASDGQVSLQGGRVIGAVTSTGATGSADPNVRGLILDSQLPGVPTAPQPFGPDQGIVTNTGLIVSRRGYISLGTSLLGEVVNSGLLEATTSVSRNGKIALSAGTVTLAGNADPAHAGAVVILPDDDGETVPQGSADSPATFKPSQITIGDAVTSYLTADTSGDIALMPAEFAMGANAFILAPGANVIIGHDAGTGAFAVQPAVPIGVTIASGAQIDVAGEMAVPLAASANTVEIADAKGNELRDDPNYRSVSGDGSFTLNGENIFVDPRVSGVSADGVAWVGSPLVEAASTISQIPVTAAQLMTAGGTISIDVGAVGGGANLDPAAVPRIAVSGGAVLDVSGGWVSYAAGTTITSQLLTADGQIVDIANADVNGVYVGIVNGFTVAQPRFGITQTYYNAALKGLHYNAAYDEGRDAGAIAVIGSEIAFDGTVHGDAFAGAAQRAAAIAPSAASAIGGDPRSLQYTPYQMPSGGLLRIGAFSGKSGIGLGQDITVYDGTRGTADAAAADLLLSDTMLSGGGLSALMLQTSGAVRLLGAGEATAEAPAVLTPSGRASTLTLADGGTLEIDAGRSITLDGTVRIADGRIAARTYQLTSVAAPGIGTVGNPFTAADDIAPVYAAAGDLPDAGDPRRFDLTVNGVLDVSGAWTNDYLGATDPAGPGWLNGGTISLTVAPKVFVPVGPSAAAAAVAGDMSGSLVIARGALLDVSAGGYVSAGRKLNLGATGGSVSLIDQTTYGGVTALLPAGSDVAGTTAIGQPVAFTPLAATTSAEGIAPELVPESERSVVRFDIASLRGFGFAGGGTLRLVSPDIAIGGAAAGADANATLLPLDVLARTGFGSLDLTSYHARIVPGLFDNASAGLSAFFDTTTLTVGAGDTLDLTQVTLPQTLSADQQAMLLALGSGAHVATLLPAGVPAVAYRQKAATLTLRGLMELDVAAGGTITGAANAAITVPKLYNAGTIDLPGGTISQVATLPAALALGGFGLDGGMAGNDAFAAVFGAADSSGQYRLDAPNVAGFTNADGTVQTNAQMFTTPGAEHFLYFTGKVANGDGIVLAAGSVTDLAGEALYNPLAAYRSDGTQYRFGTLVAGGSITTAAAYQPTNNTGAALFANPAYGYASYPDPTSNSPTPPPQLADTAARTFVAAPGATIDVSGASGLYDEAVAGGTYAPSLQWSNGGTIALLSGGTLTGATIRAQGGAAGATGGTLAWLDPTIRAGAHDPTGVAAGDNAVSAGQLAAAGFSTLVAYGGLTLDGTFSLALDKALLVRSAASLTDDAIGPNAAVTISATAGTDASVAAPYIAFASRSGGIAGSTALTGNAAVTFAAGANGMDMSGGVLFDGSIANVTLASAADVRLIGVNDNSDTSAQPVLNGALASAGNLTFDAARVYTTTGTGNLQRILDDEAGASDSTPPSPYLLEALNGSTLTIRGDHMARATPLSAGSYLEVVAGNIVQDGYLAAPLGRLVLGTTSHPVDGVVFGGHSITSVSGAGLDVPYGTTTDLTEFYFTAGTAAPLSRLPSGDLRITGNTINVLAGATVNGAGGGDVFAYEFVSGTGGSRDVLSRFNNDPFSADNYNPATGSGTQYADGRQVYAIVPAATAARVAFYDPLYAADYNGSAGSGPTNLYGAQAGLAVTLDGGQGIAAGQYVLMPAHYALLPGAYRVVANSGDAAPAPGAAQTLLDGSVVMGGTYSTAGTGLAGSQRLSFTIQSQATLLKYSRIQTTSGDATIAAQASSAGIATPRLPLDAARVVLDPLKALGVAGTFDTTAVSGGRGAAIDILGNAIVLDASGTSSGDGLVLANATIANLHANSLLIGGERTENSDDTTAIGVTANRILVTGTANIAVPELVLAVGGVGSNLTIRDGAALTASGTIDDPRAGDYIIGSVTTPVAGDPFDESGVGSLLRLSTGTQRLVSRTGAAAPANSTRLTTLNLGAATLTASALLMETTRTLKVSDGLVLAGAGGARALPSIAIGADNLSIGVGQTVDAGLEARLAAAGTLTLFSPNAIGFDANSGHSFQNLTLDAPGIVFNLGTGLPATLRIDAQALRIGNDTGAAPVCGVFGGPVCGTTGNVLSVNAASVTFLSGSFGTYAFDKAVNIAASGGAYVEGAGSLALNGAALTLSTPFLIDRAAIVNPNLASPTPSDAIGAISDYTIPVTPDYTFATTGAIALNAPAGAAATPAGVRAPGAHIVFGSAAAPVASLSIAGTAVTATAGVIDAEVRGDIALSGSATLATPGWTRSFGDSQSITTVSAGGGTVNLVSLTGSIALPAGSSIVVDSGIGSAGTLNLLAAEGAIGLGAALDPGVSGPRDASLTFDALTSAFDLDGWAKTYAAQFAGDLAVRSGVGDMTLAAGHTIAARSVSLTADGGSIAIDGTISTAGADIAGLSRSAAAAARVNGGDIALWAADAITLAAGSLLDTHTDGYAADDTRQASAGDITLGIGEGGGAITLAAGATLDLSARRTLAAQAAGQTGNRFVARTVKDPATLVNETVYDFVAADTGGTLRLRAPVIAGDSKVDVRVHGTIAGAASRQVEAYKAYDLDALARGIYDGVFATDTGVSLDATPTLGIFAGAHGNILSDTFSNADGTVSIPYFVQNFAVTAADGSDLSGWRVRPGVDLKAAGTIELDTNWNLAAGTLDVAAAQAAGRIATIPELGLRADGSAYYSVVAGQEGALLVDDVSFVYRVGGRASGEAPVLTMAAGGAIDLKASISDGFFTFADKSDATWINYQLGGGNRTYDAALLLSCGAALDCATIGDYGSAAAAGGNTAAISLARFTTGLQAGAAHVVAPYDAEANSPIAAGNNTDADGNVTGDPLGFAQLFPLLPDGAAIHATSLRLVAGAGPAASADPLHVDRAMAAPLTLEGETSYQLTATPGAAALGTGLDLALALPGTSVSADPLFAAADLVGSTSASGNVSALTDLSAVTLNWTGFATQAKWAAAAAAYFAGQPVTYSYGPGRIVTGLTAPLGEVLGFLAANARNVANWTQNGGTITGPKLINYGTQVADVRSLVRTGDGTIDVAAAGNIDLTNGATVTYRNARGVAVSAKNPTGAQVGGTAIYTAGTRVDAAALIGNVVVGGVVTAAVLGATPASPYQTITAQNADFIPSPKGLDAQAGVLADDGGAVTLAAGGSILGRRDEWSERNLGTGGSTASGFVSSFDGSEIGVASQLWRVGAVGGDSEIAIAPKYFTAGVGTLAGGDVTVRAGGDVADLSVALDSAVTTVARDGAPGNAGATLIALGAGDLAMRVGGTLAGGQVDVADGVGTVAVGGNVVGFGHETASTSTDTREYFQVRVADATVALTAQGSIALAGVSALGAADPTSTTSAYNAAGYYTPLAGFSAVATGGLTYVDNRLNQTVPFQIGAGGGGTFGGGVLPPSLALDALTGTLTAPVQPLLLYPSAAGNLQLYSAGDLSSLVIAMSDSDPSLLPGAFTAAHVNIDSVNASGGGNVTATTGLGFGIPGVDATTGDKLLRLYHNQATTHLGDGTPIVVAAGNDITNALINVPKVAQVIAGRDIVDLYFTGQNVNAGDTTVIGAGRDIAGDTASSAITNLPYIVSNSITLGGPGALAISAGRDLGPFINSAEVDNVSYAGGIQTVGNLDNPWLAASGADLSVLFGVAGGVDYAGLREAYLDPTNFAALDGALFVQTTDALGNGHPVRGQEIYDPILATWMRTNDPGDFVAIFGADALTAYPDTATGNAALTAAAYGQAQALYTAFAALPPLVQDTFLIHDVYFNELQQPAEPSSPSYLQYVRGYRAADILFPPAAGYTDNLAVYTTPAGTVSADHPQGIPVRTLVDGQPAKAVQVHTGNADLRLATVETVQGGDITILGPGGNFIAGSVVRTSTQATRRATRFGVTPNASLIYGQLTNANVNRISAIPIGYEGLLTLAGGSVSAFTDGNFLVNQSRVFTEAGGDITMWSSNGDLNAGQGPRSASNFPPVTVRLNLDGNSAVDSAGSVAGAGIGAFRQAPGDPASSVILVAPAGLVDAGDAGVRASGDVLVAAARVANADAFSAGGSVSGVPAHAAVPASAPPSSAAAAVAAQAAGTGGEGHGAPRSIITVDVLGFVGVSTGCDDPANKDAACTN